MALDLASFYYKINDILPRKVHPALATVAALLCLVIRYSADLSWSITPTVVELSFEGCWSLLLLNNNSWELVPKTDR